MKQIYLLVLEIQNDVEHLVTSSKNNFKWALNSDIFLIK